MPSGAVGASSIVDAFRQASFHRLLSFLLSPFSFLLSPFSFLLTPSRSFSRLLVPSHAFSFLLTPSVDAFRQVEEMGGATDAMFAEALAIPDQVMRETLVL